MTDAEQRFRGRISEKIADSTTGPLAAFTPRRVHGTTSFPGKATAVIGMRRAGKTTYLTQLRHERHQSGVERERLPYLSLEDDQLAGMAVTDLALILEEYYRRFPALRGTKTVTWCLDEIQIVPEWERFVRRLIDTEQAEIFVSGSSAALLSREIATSMRGRAWAVVLHPFSFEEYLRHHALAVPNRPDLLSSRERSAVERAFLDYLTVGGFPEAQGLGTADRHRLLSDYVDVTMLRDVVERHRVSNVTGLRWLVRHLLGNAAGQFSVEKFYAALRSQGFSISKDTVHELVSHLDDCFLIRTVWIESESERRRMVNPRKVYPIDTGLMPIFDRTGRANLGHALETAVLLELERRHYAVTYVRTPEGHEVDFLARHPGGAQLLVQVCATAEADGTRERELRALSEARRHYPDATPVLLVATRDGLPSGVPAGIVAKAAYEWFLLDVEDAV